MRIARERFLAPHGARPRVPPHAGGWWGSNGVRLRGLHTGTAVKAVWLTAVEAVWLTAVKAVRLTAVKAVWLTAVKAVWLTAVKAVWLHTGTSVKTFRWTAMKTVKTWSAPGLRVTKHAASRIQVRVRGGMVRGTRLPRMRGVPHSSSSWV